MTQRFRAALTALAIGLIPLLPGAAAAADKPRVVATFSVIADMVTNIAGNRIDLTTMIGPDGDSEV
jgi:zinc/manganese transport system substrate-binding protein